MMLAVNGGPFQGAHTRGHPQPETEKMCQDRMQIQRPMRRMTVQVNSDGNDGDMRHHQGEYDEL